MPKLIEVDPTAKPIQCKRCGVTVPPNQVFVSNPKPGARRGTIYRLCLLCMRNDARQRDRNKRGTTRVYITKQEKESLAAQGLRRCSTCKESKPFSAFNLQSDKVDGMQARCRICDLSAKLGVPSEHYGDAVAKHRSCQICGSTNRLCVDHDHGANRNNAVRGVLCRDCNKALGRLGDSLTVVRAALDYVLRWQKRKPAALASWKKAKGLAVKRSPMTGLKFAAALLAKGKKYCPRCQSVKSVSHFDKKPSKPCGLNSWCKLCTRAIYEGIDPVEYAAAKAITRCQTCGKAHSLHVDHDHDFSELAPVRGVLCSSCNTAIGTFKDSPELLRRAVSYLEAWARKSGRNQPVGSKKKKRKRS